LKTDVGEDDPADDLDHAERDPEQPQQERPEQQEKEHQDEGIETGLPGYLEAYLVVFTLHKVQEYRNGLQRVDDRQQCREQADEVEYRCSQSSAD
jgi:hypothetical protein